MKIQNRKGSTLVMILIVFVVLMIFGTFILSFMVNENKQSMHHQNKTQAYYIARSGAVAVEAAILDLGEVEIQKLNEELDDNGEIFVNEMTIDEGKVNVVIKKNIDDLVIESTGIIRGVDNLVINVMKGEVNSIESSLNHAVFSTGNIKIGNGTINGDIGTNDSIEITGNPTLNGDAYIRKGKTLSAEKWWRDSWVINHSTKELPTEKSYQWISFPNVIKNNSTVDFVQGGSSTTTLIANKDYNKFEINSNTKLYIDTSKQDITLNITQFNLNNGHIIILGKNKLNLYVGNMTTGSGSTINYQEGAKVNSEQLNIFYNGESKLNIAGNVKIAGNLYMDKASLEIGASGSVLGHVYCNGNTVLLSGNADITKGLLYAPNSHISFTGSGKVYGAVIGKTIDINGGGIVTFDPKYIDTSLITASNKSVLKFKPGYFK